MKALHCCIFTNYNPSVEEIKLQEKIEKLSALDIKDFGISNEMYPHLPEMNFIWKQSI